MKVMIAEDEILVRLGLRKAIPWSSLGMELICEAKDGEEALKLFQLNRPDIVLVDIEMPNMDGLKFIRTAKTLDADARFIVLTCHQDMKYTREAIQLQVSDFLLKSTLDMTELYGILQNVSSELLRSRGEADSAGAGPAAPSMSVKTFMQSWLSGAMTDSGLIRQRLAEMGLDARTERYEAWVLQSEPAAASASRQGTIGDLTREILGNAMIGGVEEERNGRWHFILAGRCPAEVLSQWTAAAKEAGCRASLGRSGSFIYPHEWPLHDRKATDLLQLQYYDEEPGIYDEGSLLSEVMSEAAQQLKKEIYECIEAMRLTAARGKIAELQRELKRFPYLHPNIVKNAMTEFLFRTWSVCEGPAGGKQMANHRLVDSLYAARSLEETVSLLIQEMEKFESHVSLTYSQDDKAKVIVLIKQYIKANLHREITLQEMANAFYINSSYLSRLFKEVSRTSFTEFVLFEKTELAIMMMKNGSSLTEISEKLGYLNLSSFTRMFKKVRGESPSRFAMTNKKA